MSINYNKIKSLGKYISLLKKSKVLQKYIDHNKRVFSPDGTLRPNTNIILLELNTMHSAHIAYGYFANMLAKNNDAKIIAYKPGLLKGYIRKIIFNIQSKIGFGEFAVYKSFGTSDFIGIWLSKGQAVKSKLLYKKIIGEINTKKDLEDLKIGGVYIGDLFYDEFLRSYSKPTFQKEWGDFQKSFKESCDIFIFWNDFIRNNNIKAINVSHCVYNLAIPLRIALHLDIPVYQTNITHIYRLSFNNQYAYNDYFFFPEKFLSLNMDVRKSGIAEAEVRINRRFKGEVGVDMSYSKKSAYGVVGQNQLLKESSQAKILIATHCFFDSPHVFGNNIFPDFYEWLDFLGKVSESTDYDWYIKTHPDYLPGNMEIIEYFLQKYRKFTLLPASASHHQLISEGINVALTTYGTIGFEYAALGIPVINASLCNPHIAYDFNLHPKDIDEYKEMLLGIKNLDFKIDKKQVYEYYFMQYIYNTANIFFSNYNKVIEKIGGYSNQFTEDIYSGWLDDWTPERHDDINLALQSFIKSGDYRMDYNHIGQQVTVESIGLNS